MRLVMQQRVAVRVGEEMSKLRQIAIAIITSSIVRWLAARKSAPRALADKMLGTSAWPTENNVGNTEAGARVTSVSRVFRIAAQHDIIFRFRHSSRSFAAWGRRGSRVG